MTVIGGRGGRNDDWNSPHERARAKAAERLDGPLDADEATWLEEHLGSCAECTVVARDYAAQRLALRALRERAPVPPRDLWARTAAAIERESRHRSLQPRRRSRAPAFKPYAVLAGALVVAIAVGTLTSSQWPFDDSTATPGASNQIAVATPTPAAVAPTPFAVGPQDVNYLSVGQDGTVALTQGRFDEVCPAGATTCTSDEMVESHKVIGSLARPETVFGSEGTPLVVVGDGDGGSSVLVVVVPTDTSGGGGPEPTETPATTPSDEPGPTDEPSTAAPASPATEPTATPSGTVAPPSDEPSPTPSTATAETVDIAPGLEIVGMTAAYAPDGSAFAFTAQPADGSHGPDIYVWTVGDSAARAVTTDHQSVFGSWSGDDIIGSSLAGGADGTSADPTAIVVSDDVPVALPDAGLAWRPAVDPSGENAVYWAGSLTASDDGDAWQTEDGRLVLGRWSDLQAPDPSASAVAPDASQQAAERDETTIVEGPLTDWDVRWDETGTRLAVWIADPDDASVGALSLYEVDPFDGSIDLENPPLSDEPALAGFSLEDGRLAWAAPPGGTDDEGRVLILAWTDESFGQVESAPGDVLLIR